LPCLCCLRFLLFKFISVFSFKRALRQASASEAARSAIKAIRLASSTLGSPPPRTSSNCVMMSAGSGVTHSEFNPLPNEPLHLLQIWIKPRAQGLPPSYTEWHPTPDSESAAKLLVISPDGRDNSATIQQDARIYRLRWPSITPSGPGPV
jgi:hypothetical protein